MSANPASELGRFGGVYRGKIVDVKDPESRSRYRVHVPTVYGDLLSVESLPWAEMSASWGGRGFGDIAHYEVGDLVMVQFEGGRSDYPVVTGGWISNRDGVKDRLPEQTQAGAEGRKKWMRTDRRGNVIEMSELDDELHIKLASGNVTLVLSQVDDSLRIKTTGTVAVEAGIANITSGQTFLISKDIVLNTNGKDENGKPNGQINIISNANTTVFADEVVYAGQYVDKNKKVHQTLAWRLAPNRLVLGNDSDGVAGQPLKTFNVTIGASQLVSVTSKGTVKVESPLVDIVAAQGVTITSPKVDIKGSA